MFNLEIFIGVLVVFASVYYYLFNIRGKKSNFPPGPTGLPIVGILPFLNGHPSQFGKIAKKYGNIFSVPLGSFRVVVLNDYSSIRKAFRQDVFAGRPKCIPAMAITSDGISFNEGVAWNDQRKFTLKALRELGFGKSQLEDSIREEVQNLMDYLRLRVNKPIYLKDIFEISIINTLWSIVASRKYALDDPDVLYMINVCYAGFIEPKVAGPVWFLPWLANMFPSWTGFTALKTATKKMQEVFNKLIEERKKTFSPDKLHDFVDIYLQRILSEKDPKSSFYKEVGVNSLVHVLTDLFTAGSDTTSSTLSWTILYLLHYPEVQSKLHSEMVNAVGDDLPTVSDRAKMPYTEATLAEVFRMSSIVSGALLHSTLEDTEFEGYKLPKGTIVMSNLWEVHHDAEHWKDPFNFRPERFLDANGIYSKDDFLIPFGIGKRICPAENLASTNAFLFLTSLIHNFEVKGEPGCPLPSLEPKEGLVLATQNYKVILKARK